jgi:hypothetical protein
VGWVARLADEPAGDELIDEALVRLLEVYAVCELGHPEPAIGRFRQAHQGRVLAQRDVGTALEVLIEQAGRDETAKYTWWA